MAKVEHRKAAKDYPKEGIKKGDMYYFAAVKTGPYSSKTIRQLTPIKPAQLTSSEYLSRLYEWEESKDALSDMGDAQELADTIRELGEEQQEKFDNMPEGLQQGSTGEMLQERAEACEQAASDIEEVISEWENDRDAHDELHQDVQDAKDAIAAADNEEDEDLQDALSDAEDALRDSDFDEDDFIERVKEVGVQ